MGGVRSSAVLVAEGLDPGEDSILLSLEIDEVGATPLLSGQIGGQVRSAGEPHFMVNWSQRLETASCTRLSLNTHWTTDRTAASLVAQTKSVCLQDLLEATQVISEHLTHSTVGGFPAAGHPCLIGWPCCPVGLIRLNLI